MNKPFRDLADFSRAVHEPARAAILTALGGLKRSTVRYACSYCFTCPYLMSACCLVVSAGDR